MIMTCHNAKTKSKIYFSTTTLQNYKKKFKLKNVLNKNQFEAKIIGENQKKKSCQH